MQGSPAGERKTFRVFSLQEKAPGFSGAFSFSFTALHACRGSLGLTANHYEVDPLVVASGVPLDGRLAHRVPEENPG